MGEDFQKLRTLLAGKGIEDNTSLLPIDIRDTDMTPLLRSLQNATLDNISKDNRLIPFLTDTFGVSAKADLKAIEGLLKGYREVTCDFFKDSAPKSSSSSVGFTTAAGRSLDPEAETAQYQTSSTAKRGAQKSQETGLEEHILERIKMEILETDPNVTWDDIVGLKDVKKAINEIILWPMLRPDIFTGLRGPPKGLLLFGPPGTGKTMIGKCIASQCKATFFSISASSLTSKWVGEGEKMVRALFYLARKMAPSVIFIDEIDSLLSQRSDNENEGSRKIKTEFLVQFDGAAVNDDDRILVIGATNRPHEIDEAARRRLVKRIYVPLPEKDNRVLMVNQLLSSYPHMISPDEYEEIGVLTDGYSGSDMFNLCREATLEPLREIVDIYNVDARNMRAISVGDFKKAMRQIRKSVSPEDLRGYAFWNDNFGSMPR